MGWMGGVGSGSCNDPGVRTNKTGEGTGPSKQGGQRAAAGPGAEREPWRASTLVSPQCPLARVCKSSSGCGGIGRRQQTSPRPMAQQPMPPSIHPISNTPTGNLPMDIREVRLYITAPSNHSLSLPPHPPTRTQTQIKPNHSATWRSCLGSTAASAPWTSRHPRGTFTGLTESPLSLIDVCMYTIHLSLDVWGGPSSFNPLQSIHPTSPGRSSLLNQPIQTCKPVTIPYRTTTARPPTPLWPSRTCATRRTPSRGGK